MIGTAPIAYPLWNHGDKETNTSRAVTATRFSASFARALRRARMERGLVEEVPGGSCGHANRARNDENPLKSFGRENVPRALGKALEPIPDGLRPLTRT
jgi:hypothetical protein